MMAQRNAPGADQCRMTRTAQLVRALRETPCPEQARRLRQELAVVNLPIATTVALRYRTKGEAVEDLIQVARLGLVKAVNAFDADRGSHFLAFAVPTISGEVKRHFRDQGWDIRPPRRIQELRSEVEQAAGELAQLLGRSPTLGEIGQRLGADQDDVVECVASADLYRVHSLDAAVGGAEELLVGDLLGAVDPLIDQIEDILSVRPLIDRLSPRDRRILALRYFSDWTQQQIADDVGVTQMQVSRLITKTLQRLREGLAAA